VFLGNRDVALFPFELCEYVSDVRVNHGVETPCLMFKLACYL
jgi:hypothetical protein